MHRVLPVTFVLIALFLTACTTGTTPRAALDGPTTTITLAPAEGGVSTLGVPFVGGQSVVTSVGVEIAALDGQDFVELRFTLEDGVYAYDPDGELASIDFAFTDDVTVTLPAGLDYGFRTRGEDVQQHWLAYGVTFAYVDVTTVSVPLVLQTMIDGASLTSDPTIDAIAAARTVDLLLGVTSPGGYAVPSSDYTVSYAIATDDGSVTAASRLGAQVRAHDTPTSDRFTVTATITGWRNVGGEPVVANDVVATFDVPFTIPTGIGFDASAPVATITAAAKGTVGTPLALSGTATDDTGLDRVQVYVGPVLIASSAASDLGDGVTELQLVADAWSFDWTPTTARTHTFTALAIDTAGNEHRVSTSVDVAVAEATVITFVQGTASFVTMPAGGSAVLTAPSFIGLDSNDMWIYLFEDVVDHIVVSLAGFHDDGVTWTVPWTAPTAGSYILDYVYDGIGHGTVFLTVE